jgi:hypothetical protein
MLNLPLIKDKVSLVHKLAVNNWICILTYIMLIYFN